MAGVPITDVAECFSSESLANDLTSPQRSAIRSRWMIVATEVCLCLDRAHAPRHESVGPPGPDVRAVKFEFGASFDSRAGPGRDDQLEAADRGRHCATHKVDTMIAAEVGT